MATRRQCKEEQIKAIAGIINNIGLGILGFGVLRPLIDTTAANNTLLGSAIVALACWVIAFYVLRQLEEKSDAF